MSTTSKVTAKGQVCIPAELRRKFCINEGAVVSFVVKAGELVLRPMVERRPPLSDQDLADCLDPKHQAEIAAFQKAAGAGVPDHYES
jgi:AbrB family looped-hinge helix DNA binding protein